MVLTETLQNAINSYHFSLSNGLEFWSPYLINLNYTQDNNVPRGMGKAAPEDILASAEYILSLFPYIDAESIRKKLIDGSLPEQSMNYKGVDCSGFVFHVFNRLYKELKGHDLATILSVPKQHVLNGAQNLAEWQEAYTLSDEEARELPENVPMSWVVEKFHRKPANLCRVASLVSDYASTKIDDLKDMNIGDLVHMITPGSDIPHVAIITELQPTQVTVVHSQRQNPDDAGGVVFEMINYTDQAVDCSQLKVPRDYLGIYRLKGL